MAIVPKVEHLYHCRYGHRGARQICLFLSFRGDDLVVRKWLANSGRWTGQIVIGKHDLLRAASREDIRKLGVKINLKN